MSDFFNEHVMRFHWETLKMRRLEWLSRSKKKGD